MAHNQKLGKVGENIAAAWLRAQGYRILERNWRFHHKEIDIIAEKGEELVIVEVKTREEQEQHPGELVTLEKERFLIQAADAYIRKHAIDKETRFDVILITFRGGEHELEHVPRAFYPTM